MKFSVVIPLFNKQLYIKQTLSSVLIQNYKDFEVLVVDDGSTDDSIVIVNAIDDDRIRVICQQNAGVSVARNRAIHEANGEWICFLDADDWQHPEYLSEVMKLINKFPHVDAVAARFKSIPDSEHWNPEVWPLQPAQYEIIEDLPKRWMQEIPFFTGSIVIRKKLLTTLSPCFPIGESCGEDLDVWFRVAEKTNIVLLNQPLVAYRTAIESSLSSTSNHSIHAPYLRRMTQRAPLLPFPIRRSTMDFVAHQFITRARVEASLGFRLVGMKLLIQVVHIAWRIRRWWVTLFMLLIFPKAAIRRLQQWRECRTNI